MWVVIGRKEENHGIYIFSFREEEKREKTLLAIESHSLLATKTPVSWDEPQVALKSQPVSKTTQ